MALTLTLSLTLALTLALLGLLLPAETGPKPAVAQAQAQAGCRLEHRRVVHAGFAVQEQEIEIELRYAFDCRQRQPRRDLAIVLDVQAFADDPEATRARSDALKAGLRAFLGWIGEDDAPRVALLRSLSDSHVLDLAPTFDLDALRSAVEALEVVEGEEGLPEPGGLGSAIDAAVTALGDEAGIDRAILIFDGGAALQQGPEGPVNPPATACAAARAAGIRLATVSHSASQRRLQSDCASYRYFYAPGDERAPDLSAAFERVGQAVFHPRSAVQAEYADFVKPGFSYVEGSGIPREPDLVALSERGWQDEIFSLEGEFELGYRIRVDRGTGELVTPLSTFATVALELLDGDVQEWSLRNPAICVHWPTLESFCYAHIRRAGPGRAWLPGLGQP